MFGALATYFSTGCGAALPTLPPEVRAAAEGGLCAKSAIEAAGDPAQLTVVQAIALANSVRACFAPPVASDAGA